MRPSQITGIAIAAFLTVTPSAWAQTPAKSSDTAATQTFAGCLMTERDYRTAHKLGAGQAGGAGLGDEYVLVDVKISPAKATAATTPASETSAARVQPPSGASSKCADEGPAYRLTGSDEEQLRNLVGLQLEIQGRFKDPADGGSSGARPEGTLPAEVEMISFREAPAPAGATPAPPSSPTSPPAASARPQTASPPLPAPTADPARGQAAAPPAAERRELPQTATSTGVFALIGVVALSSGLALALIRRRVWQT